MPAGASSSAATVPSVAFVPPELPADVLSRPQLEGRLGPSTGSRLSLVTGPPGAGKTTLTRHWASQLPGGWAWITLDAALGRRDRFWAAFVGALHVAVPGTAFDIDDVVGGDTVDDGFLARAVVDDLLRLCLDDGPVVIVVDDAHLLDADAWRDVEWLVHHQPAALHLVLVSRSDPPFPIARLRALGQLSEVRQHDLAFTREETGELVRRQGGDDVPAGLAAALQQRTEGWAAGIRLGLISARRGGVAPADALTTHDEAHGFVSELLISEGLDRLPPDRREFLTRTCVVGLLEPRLCDALTGRCDSREVLRGLASDHLFITPLQDRPDRYRFHPLFAEVLRLELRSSAPSAEAAQDLAASRWFEAEGRHREAIEHALAGGHYDDVLRVVVGHLRELYAQGQRRAVGQWLLAIPDSFIRSDPERAVQHCAALLFLVRPEWMRWLPRARSVVGDNRPDLRARLELFAAFAPAGRGYVGRFEQAVAAARKLRPPGTEEPFDEVVDAWRARLLVLHGDASRALEIAHGVCRRPRLLIGDLAASAGLAAAAFAAGDPSAVELTADAIAQWRSDGEPDVLGMADALCVGSELALRRGDLDEAELLAAGAVAVAGDRPIHLLGVRAEVALANVETATGRANDARARLREVRRLLDDRGADAAVLALVSAAMPGERAVDQGEQRRSASPALVEPLTEREVVILDHLASHRTYPEIGRELYISRHTVKTHVSRIYRKLGVMGRSQAVAVAVEHGLLQR